MSRLQDLHYVAVECYDQTSGAVRFLAILYLAILIHRSSLSSTIYKIEESYGLFNGNDVPLELAYTFYNACNGTAPRFVVEQSREWYCVLQCSRYKPYMAQYYMIFKKLIYINGSRLNQLELVLPEVTVRDFGIDNTTHPQLIRRKLEKKMIEVDCD